MIEAVAREVAAILRHQPPPAMLTAREVAMQLGVTPEWVYSHAEELGAVRLGDGPRPRVRFDPAVVQQRLLPPQRVPTRQVTSGANGTAPLLPIKPTRSRRNLEEE